MNIRSITCFIPGWPLAASILHGVTELVAAARAAYEIAGYPVQTTRLATEPFASFVSTSEAGPVVELACKLEEESQQAGFEYVSLGPAMPGSLPSYAVIPEVLGATQSVFLSGCMTTPGGGISLAAVRACAEVIYRAASLTPDGFSNLRFAALANVPAGSPFFPAAYHAGGEARFTLAIEAAGLAVEAVSRAGSLAESRQNLVSMLESHAEALARVAGELSSQTGMVFGGIDFSLAPYPDEARSTGGAIERLGIPAIGLHGSLAAAAFLAEAIDRAHYPRAGFNGLLLPVLEDVTLGLRAGEGNLSLKDLLLYSAVCGTGLDTIPLPGDSSPGALAAVLLDLASLAQRLDKPLTARLMPIPGKTAGEWTNFDFAYFTNTRVLELPAQPLTGLMAGEETYSLHPLGGEGE